MNKKLAAVTLIASIFLGFFIGYAVQPYIVTIPTSGTVKGVGIAITWTANATEVTHINWRIIDNATAYTLPETLNITNTNNTVCTLSLATENLSSNILSLTLTWNYSGSPLAPLEWQIVALTLTPAISNTEQFTFDIKIIATEAT